MLHASTLHHLYLESGKVTLVLCGISTRTLWNPRCAARALLGGRRCGHLALPFPRTLWLRLLLHSQSSVLVTLRLGRCPVPDSSAFMAVRPQQRFQRSATSHRPLKLCNYLLTRARETRDGGESHLLCSRVCSALRINPRSTLTANSRFSALYRQPPRYSRFGARARGSEESYILSRTYMGQLAFLVTV